MKRLLDQVGTSGVAAIMLLAAALAFSSLVVKPLEEKSLQLKEKASRQAPRGDAGGSGEKVAAVYAFLTTEESTTDLLAKLHGIGVATGVQLKSANYRTQKTEGRIVRTEIVVPVSGSYGQIRDFLKRSLAEMPMLSIDRLTLKRDAKAGGAIQAEMRLTLHRVAS